MVNGAKKVENIEIFSNFSFAPCIIDDGSNRIEKYSLKVGKSPLVHTIPKKIPVYRPSVAKGKNTFEFKG